MTNYNYEDKKKNTKKSRFLFIGIGIIVLMLLGVIGLYYYGNTYEIPSSEHQELHDVKDYLTFNDDRSALMLEIRKQDLLKIMEERANQRLAANPGKLTEIVFDQESEKVYVRVNDDFMTYTGLSSFDIAIVQGQVYVTVGDFTFANLFRLPQAQNELFRSQVESSMINIIDELKINDLLKDTYGKFVASTEYSVDDKNVIVTWNINYDAISEEWYLNTYNTSRLLQQFFLGQEDDVMRRLASALDDQEGPTKEEIIDFVGILNENYNDISFLQKLQLLLSSTSYEYYANFFSPFMTFNEGAVTVPSYFEQYAKREIILPIVQGKNAINYSLGMTMDDVLENHEALSIDESEDSWKYTFEDEIIVTANEEGIIESLYFENGISSGILEKTAEYWEYAEVFFSAETTSGENGEYFGYVHTIGEQKIEIRLHQSTETYEILGVEFIIM